MCGTQRLVSWPDRAGGLVAVVEVVVVSAFDQSGPCRRGAEVGTRVQRTDRRVGAEEADTGREQEGAVGIGHTDLDGTAVVGTRKPAACVVGSSGHSHSAGGDSRRHWEGSSHVVAAAAVDYTIVAQVLRILRKDTACGLDHSYSIALVACPVEASRMDCLPLVNRVGVGVAWLNKTSVRIEPE